MDMDTEASHDAGMADSGSPDRNDSKLSTAQQKANISAKLRKRTKTGCLTCRKRRIKCGEERPICNNCIKSKRQCEGYNPRVVWKAPMGDWPGSAVADEIPFHTGGMPGARPLDYQQYGQTHGHPLYGPHTPIQPRPLIGGFDFSKFEPNHLPSHVNAPLPQDQLMHQQMYNGGPENGYVEHMGLPYSQASDINPMVGQVPQTPQTHAFTANGSSQIHPQLNGVAPIVTDLPYHGISHPTNHQLSQTPLNHTPSQPVSHQISPEHQHFSATFATQPTAPAPFTDFSAAPQPMVDHQQQHRLSLDVGQAADTGQINGYPTVNGVEHHQEPQMPMFGPPIEDQKIQVLDKFNHTQGYSIDTFDSIQSAALEPSPEHVFGPQPTRSQVDTRALEAQLINADYDQRHLNTSDALDRAAIEYHDDEYFDVEEEDEYNVQVDQMGRSDEKHERDFGLIMELYHKHTSDRAMRRMDAFLYDGMLDHYHAEWVANPLKNPHTARVFAHFVHASAPMLSIHDRNPLNSQHLFNSGTAPGAQRSFWTYTLPMMALNNQGLLHAMLAIGSLHIARLQGASSTPSFKHYAYALKRIHGSVGHSNKRHQVTTVAASLLLAFYELMTADHLKWSSHLVGSKQLLIEIDYRKMTRQAKLMKAQQARYDKEFAWHDPSQPIPPRPYANVFKVDLPLPNEEILSTIIGKKLRYDDTGRVIEDFDDGYDSIPPSIDMAKFEIFQDLWWWYIRQDAYQSIISGNKLLMEYSRWGDCPPRAPIGRSDAVHASHDHIMLMLGRIANFASNDRVRKVKVMKSQGGHWRPDPQLMGHMMMRTAGSTPAPSPIGPPAGFGAPVGAQGPVSPPGVTPGYPMGAQIAASLGAPPPFPPQTPLTPMTPLGPPMAGAPMGPPPTPGSANSASPQGPSFYGMAPSTSRVFMPSSYRGRRQLSPENPEEPELDLQSALHEALEEWQQINAALNVFASNLGPNFQPMSEEYHQPRVTPFGHSIQYRSYDIANVWAIYKMAKIITIRSHPAMPPAAMMAAAVAAPQTAQLANEIGRIASGLPPAPSNAPLNPSLSAALISSIMPLFFAGVQYTDAAQRAWLVPHIRDIEARTGFASAGLIAQGCEIAWEKAGEAGRGPPYRATRRTGHHDDRLSGSSLDGGGRVVVQPDLEEKNPMEAGVSGFVPLRDHSGEQRLVPQTTGRVHWAMGVLAEGQDLREDRKTGT